MKHIIVAAVLLVGFCGFAQEEDKEAQKALQVSKNLTWEANKEISENKFTTAEANYRKAIAKSGENVAAPFNLGNAYYNNETYSEAFTRFKQAGELTADKGEKHKAFHNMGNVFMKNKQYEKAVEGYKQALRNNPKDEETRYNLALAKELLKKQQDEEKKDDKKKDKDKDKEEDKKDDKKKDDKKDGDDKKDDKGDQKDDKDKDKGDEGEDGDKKKDENKKGDGEEKKEKKEQQKKQPRPNQLSPQQVKNLLQAMQNEEKKVQKKMDAKKVKGVKVKTEKDW
ncbi:MAG: tetratricopeptide repeat protein [Cellulophaga sp.]